MRSLSSLRGSPRVPAGIPEECMRHPAAGTRNPPLEPERYHEILKERERHPAGTRGTSRGRPRNLTASLEFPAGCLSRSSGI